MLTHPSHELVSVNSNLITSVVETPAPTRQKLSVSAISSVPRAFFNSSIHASVSPDCASDANAGVAFSPGTSKMASEEAAHMAGKKYRVRSPRICGMSDLFGAGL